MIPLAELRDEAQLIAAERRDALERQMHALAMRERRVTFTAEEIEKRARRLPRVDALARGVEQLAARREEAPAWILAAFEGLPNE